jgi:hypothetical protein
MIAANAAEYSVDESPLCILDAKMGNTPAVWPLSLVVIEINLEKQGSCTSQGNQWWTRSIQDGLLSWRTSTQINIMPSETKSSWLLLCLNQAMIFSRTESTGNHDFDANSQHINECMVCISSTAAKSTSLSDHITSCIVLIMISHAMSNKLWPLVLSELNGMRSITMLNFLSNTISATSQTKGVEHRIVHRNTGFSFIPALFGFEQKICILRDLWADLNWRLRQEVLLTANWANTAFPKRKEKCHMWRVNCHSI